MAHASHAPAPTKAPPPAGGHVEGFMQTWRTDDWWLGPALTLAGLGGFGIYMTIVAWMASYYVAGPYLSPFYSPPLFIQAGQAGGGTVDQAWLGAWPSFWPSWLPASPAFWIIPLPTMFRGTCYYYRKAYYRSFFGLPPACAVGPMSYGRYEGETFLLVFQNLHRYTFYVALLLLPCLFYEAFRAMVWGGQLGIGLGTVFLFVNATLLTLYTFGCHSLRHLVGGQLNCFSCDAQSQFRGGVWKRVSWLNARHMQFAWASLLWFMATDIYIRGISLGFFPDINTWEGLSWSMRAGGHF
jgi:hypothetical protein